MSYKTIDKSLAGIFFNMFANFKGLNQIELSPKVKCDI